MSDWIPNLITGAVGAIGMASTFGALLLSRKWQRDDAREEQSRQAAAQAARRKRQLRVTTDEIIEAALETFDMSAPMPFPNFLSRLLVKIEMLSARANSDDFSALLDIEMRLLSDACWLRSEVNDAPEEDDAPENDDAPEAGFQLLAAYAKAINNHRALNVKMDELGWPWE